VRGHGGDFETSSWSSHRRKSMSSSNILIVLVQNTDKTPQKKRNIRNYVSFFYLFISHEKEKQTKNIYKKK
jgi:hypothetical protein